MAVFTAVVLSLLVTMAAFAVDLGMQRVLRSDVQAVADVVALDAARLLDGRTAQEIIDGDSAHPGLQAAVEESWQRNDDTVGSLVSVEPTLVYFAEDVHGRIVPERTVSGALVPVPNGQVPDGVLIEAEGEVGFGFAGALGVDSGSASRVALADARPFACMRIGSYAVGVDTNDSVLLNGLLGDLLGTELDVRLVGYQGLAAADLTLLELAEFLPATVDTDDLGVGTVDQLLGAELSVAELATAALAALTNGEDAEISAEVEGELADLVAVIDTAVDAGLLDDLTLGALLGIQQGQQAALGVTLNVLDLLVSSVEVASGDYAVELNDLAFKSSELPEGLRALAPTVELVGEAKVVPKPRMACGPEGTTARTAAVELNDVGVTIDPNPSALAPFTQSNPLATLTIDPVTAELDVAAAEAEATMTKIVCGQAVDAASAEGIDVSVASTLIGAQLSLSPIHLQGELLGNGQFAAVGVDLTVGLANPVSTMPAPVLAPQSFRHPPQDYDTPLEFGSGTVVSAITPSSAALVLNGTIEVLGFDITISNGSPTYDNVLELAISPTVGLAIGVLNATVLPAIVSGIVNPLLDLVNWLFADPLGELLGIKVAGADVFGVPRPLCDSVALRG